MLRKAFRIFVVVVVGHGLYRVAHVLGVAPVLGFALGWAVAAWVIWRAWPHLRSDVRAVFSRVPMPNGRLSFPRLRRRRAGTPGGWL